MIISSILEIVLKKLFLCFFVWTFTQSVQAAEIDLNQFAKSYFEAWKATQFPKATPQDIENYLSFLTNDVGHQHLPYASDDSRLPSGKDDMRKGMSFYLGAHQTYSAKLNQIIPAHNVVIIRYSTSSSGIHPQTKELVELNFEMMEVLEIENGKVSVIRKYDE